MNYPRITTHKGYDVDLHYSPEEQEFFCSIWKDGKSVRWEFDTGADTQTEAVKKAITAIEDHLVSES